MSQKYNKQSSWFISIMDERIKAIVRPMLFGLPRMWGGTVIAVSGSLPNQTANVELDIDKGTGITRDNLKNKSGEALVANDEVYIIAPRGQSLSNAYILTKK